MSSIGVKGRKALLKRLLLGSLVFNEVPGGWESVISLAGPDAWADKRWEGRGCSCFILRAVILASVYPALPPCE